MKYFAPRTRLGWLQQPQLALFLCLVCVIHPPLTSAQSSSIVISELYPAPVGDEREWVEVVNLAVDPVTLTDWWLSDELTTPSSIYRFSTVDAPLQPGEFRQLLLTTNKLNNAGDGVLLLRPDGTIVSRLFYTASQNGQSQQRLDTQTEGSVSTAPTPGADNPLYPLLTQLDSQNQEPTTSPTPSPSPAPSPLTTPSPSISPAATLSPTSSPTPLPSPLAAPLSISPNQITVSEIFACPSDGLGEWIELFNAGGALSVVDWRVTDRSGNFRLINGQLAGSSYTTFTWSGSLLNNTGDSFTVTSDSGQDLAVAEYAGCSTGKALIRDGNDEWVSAIASPGLANPVLSPTPTPTPSPTPSAASTASLSTPQSNLDATAPRNESTVVGRAQTSAVTIPWIDPQTVQLAKTATTAGVIDQAKRIPRVLGSYTNATLPNRPWGLLFVIMAGLFFVLAGSLPPYVASLEKDHGLDSGLAASLTLG